VGQGEERHDRQRLIPEWEQSRITAATAVVIGMGALGNEVAKNLALLGVGHLLLCDHDTVAVSNLSRTVLFTDDDVGHPKAETAAAALSRLAPRTRVTPRGSRLTNGVGLGELADAGVVLACLDSHHARLELLSRCSLVDTALVDGGTSPWGGEVRLRLDRDFPCFACSLPQSQRAEIDQAVSCDPRDDAPQPASIIATSIVAGWMTAAAVKVLLGSPPRWRFLEISAERAHTAPVRVTRLADCPYHEASGPVERSCVRSGARVADLLATLPEGADPLAWASFPVPGPCPNCGELFDPGPDADSGAVPCSHCGQQVRPDVSRWLRDAAPSRRLCDLGVAPEEIIPVRVPEGGYRWLRTAA
jgi:molybdopterin-synthase adenylyltransferase